MTQPNKNAEEGAAMLKGCIVLTILGGILLVVVSVFVRVAYLIVTGKWGAALY